MLAPLFPPRPGEAAYRCRTCGLILPESAYGRQAGGTRRYDCRECQVGLPLQWFQVDPVPTNDDWREILTLRRRILHERPDPPRRQIMGPVL